MQSSDVVGALPVDRGWLDDRGMLDALCTAVAADTGVPVGRVKKVLLSAQRQQGVCTAPSPPPTALHGDPLRHYPLGANGRTYPPDGGGR
jgi:hypothetical protein